MLNVMEMMLVVTIMSDWCLWHKPTPTISQLPPGLVG